MKTLDPQNLDPDNSKGSEDVSKVHEGLDVMTELHIARYDIARFGP